MEVWSDLVNLNLFANSIRKYAPPLAPIGVCAHARAHARTHTQFCDLLLNLNLSSSLACKAFLCVRAQMHKERRLFLWL